jgi:type IV pilus assembly protein PilE
MEHNGFYVETTKKPMIMKNYQAYQGRLKAFTLTEILVVLIIIGILVLLALPNLMPLISKAKSTEAKLQLEHVYTLEKNYFYEKSRYSKDFAEISFEQQKLTTDGGQANYRIEIVDAGNNNFRARATAVLDFNGDGNFDTWEIDQNQHLIETIPD